MLYLSPFITVYCCVIAALLGACMASFLGCLGWRVVHGESVLRGRSHCDLCGHVLSWRDLIPVFSYLASRGHCRYCGGKLSARHVWGEIVGAAVFLTLLLKYDISLQVLEAWLLACILMACSFADLEGSIIPDRFILSGLALFIVSVILSPQSLQKLIYGALGGLCVAGGLLALLVVLEKCLQRELMGGGDIKLLFLTGLFLGWQRNLLCLFLPASSASPLPWPSGSIRGNPSPGGLPSPWPPG